MELKAGNPTSEELLNLAHDVGIKWKNLGRALGIPENIIETLDEENKKFIDKAYKMLLTWSQGRGYLEANYNELNVALRHITVLRTDLAEKYCCVLPAVMQHGPVVHEDVI